MPKFNFNLTQNVTYRAAIEASNKEGARAILDQALDEGDWGGLDIAENDCTEFVIEGSPMNNNMSSSDEKKSPARMLDEAGAMEKAGLLGSVWRHKKSETLYEITGFCFLEATVEPAVLYSKHGSNLPEPIWARGAAEFFDGRFVRQSN